jgi:formylglycine-generating enzyme required for sulfatase activity
MKKIKAMNGANIFSLVRVAMEISGVIVVSVLLVTCSGSDRSQRVDNVQPGANSQTSIPNPSPVSPETELATRFSDEHGVPMALVPAGPFEMGSYEGDEDEQPVHTVMLDHFYIDQFEVTNGQYAICVDAGVCDPTTDTTAFESSYTRKNYYGNPDYLDFPVIYANWYEAKEYCEWRGARLPTEAEWEKAARGGLIGKNYPWGNESPLCEVGAKNGAKFDDDDVCNDTDTAQVGSYSHNGYGLYDMAGNVWEWVSDFYDADYYANSPGDNPSGPENGNYPVVRGGSWDSQMDHLRVSDRRFNDPKSGALSSGFRCARSFIP